MLDEKEMCSENENININIEKDENSTIEFETEHNFETKFNELNDKYIRLYSEFENYKRRTNVEKTKLVQTANKKAVLEMLSVEDNFERAEKDEALTDGMKIVRNDLINSLAKLGVKKMECNGQTFDPEIHEALSQIPVDEDKKGIIIDVVENGYTMDNMVIRFPKVIVGC